LITNSSYSTKRSPSRQRASGYSPGTTLFTEQLRQLFLTPLLYPPHQTPTRISVLTDPPQDMKIHTHTDYCRTNGNCSSFQALKFQGLMAILRAPLLFILSKASW